MSGVGSSPPQDFSPLPETFCHLERGSGTATKSTSSSRSLSSVLLPGHEIKESSMGQDAHLGHTVQR
jgi:hypothetical protein